MSVVTLPVLISVLRIILFALSQIKRFVPSEDIWIGKLNLAEVPVPSAVPEVPQSPAKVVTFPVEISYFRMQ